jgi:hypothetical protein
MSEFTVGIDLGSFKTSIVASNGQRAVVESIVGQPKDGVASRVLARKVAKRAFGGRVLFGKDVHGERLALNVIRPFEQAILKYRSADQAGLTEDDVSERRRASSVLLHVPAWKLGASSSKLAKTSSIQSSLFRNRSLWPMAWTVSVRHWSSTWEPALSTSAR